MKLERISPYKNLILASLPKGELRALEPYLEPIDLPRKSLLFEPGKKIAFAYFLEEGLVSIVVPLEEGSTIEVGVVGREGMVGLSLLMESDRTPSQAFVQIAGAGFRIRADTFVRSFLVPSQLRMMLLRSLQLYLVHASQTAACNRRHEVEERMARWLLICHDRVNSNNMSLTQEHLAQMLGTRRSSVTVAARTLHRHGLIDYSRGHVTILNHEGLKRAACECYRVLHDEQERLGLLLVRW